MKMFMSKELKKFKIILDLEATKPKAQFEERLKSKRENNIQLKFEKDNKYALFQEKICYVNETLYIN